MIHRSFRKYELIEISPAAVISALDKIDNGTFKTGTGIPPLWDGKSTDRIVNHIYNLSLKGSI